MKAKAEQKARNELAKEAPETDVAHEETKTREQAHSLALATKGAAKLQEFHGALGGLLYIGEEPVQLPCVPTFAPLHWGPPVPFAHLCHEKTARNIQI